MTVPCDAHRGTHWLALQGTFTETVTFDLGGTYNLSTVEVLNTSNTNWNDSETDRFTVATSTDGGATFGAPGPEIELQDFTEGFQTVPLQASGATHVQLVVTNDGEVDGDPPPLTEARVGLNEVRFFTGPGTAFEITSVRRIEEDVERLYLADMPDVPEGDEIEMPSVLYPIQPNGGPTHTQKDDEKRP